jgi:sugar lactone lactonase YvrE
MTGSDDLQTLLEGLTFPEAPRWHEGRLWCSDFYSHRVLAVDERGHAETIVRVPQQPSGLGWTPAGTLRVVSMLDRRLLALEDGALRTVADLSALAGGPCNDMVLDATGRAYVGNFGFDRSAGEPERPAALVRVDADGRVTRVADDLHFPNGTVLTPDGRTLIVAETYAGRLTAFDVHPDGALAGRRVFAQIDDCRPDGICLDAEGAVWVADPGGCRLLRVFEGGRIAHALPLAGRRPYACMLGGADRRTLYVCTSTGSGPAMADKTDGRIEFMRVDVPGAGLP